MPWDDIEDTIGDQRRTLEQDYYGKSKKSSGTKAFAKINKLRAVELKEKMFEQQRAAEKAALATRAAELQGTANFYKALYEAESKERIVKESELLLLHRQNASLLHEKMINPSAWPALLKDIHSQIGELEFDLREKLREYRKPLGSDSKSVEVLLDVAILLLNKLGAMRLSYVNN
jgi:hypothetical protein